MSLISLWNSNKEDIESKQIQQLVGLAGDGKLRDSSNCCKEIREYFSQIEVGSLGQYINQLLEHPFTDSGLVLQDAVNEIGRRLDFEVIDGLYQGRKDKIGYDGLWKAPDDFSIVTEVKTTDAYRISLDTVATYRDKLIEGNLISHNSSILIVVGRQDTGDLEAQVRGSRHAWDIRIISAESLIALAKIKLNSEEATGEKMQALLRPIEYTRLDELVDIVYTTAQDSEETAEDDSEGTLATKGDSAKSESGWEFTDTKLLDAKREAIIKRFSEEQGKTLIKKTRATYWSADHELRVACTISKPYTRGSQRYWYAYHPRWDKFLEPGKDAYIILGGMDLDFSFAIPRDVFVKNLQHLNITEKPDGKSYWHISIVEPESGDYQLSLSKIGESLDLNPYIEK